MEKFIWNAIGVLLFVENIWAMMVCLALGGHLWGLVLIAIAGIDLLYAEKRPVWL